MSTVRGMGAVYLRGRIYWVKYYRNGRPMRESSRSESIEAAKRLLKKRAGEVAEGKQISPRADRVRLAELLDDWLIALRVAGRKSLPQAKIRARNLLDFFGARRAHSIGAADVRAYVVFRQEQGIRPGTINLELAALRRAYALGLAAEKIHRYPRFERLPVNNVRQGFFEAEAFEAVRAALRQEVLQDMATLAYWIGWRSSEVRDLECRQVDVELKALRLERGRTKGKEPRTVYLPAEAWVVVAKWYARRRVGARISRYLFHRNGKQVRTFWKAWTSACERAGRPGMLFHDLRRTAVRNMVRAGVRDGVAMAITGHRTRAIFDRYNIIAEDDLREAAAKMSAASRAELDESGHKQGHNSQTGRRVK